MTFLMGLVNALGDECERAELLTAQHLTAEGLERASSVVKTVYLVVSALTFLSLYF